jgi:6-pyruvoyl-tetrahydropterin synthase
MGRKPRDGQRQSDTPAPISPIRTELDKLCNEDGGPADIGLDAVQFGMYCSQFPLRCVVPILSPFNQDAKSVRRHWPWAAFALSLYLYEIEERKKYADEPAPKQVRELLSGISKAAGDLSAHLRQLQTLALRFTDPSAPHRRAHLRWLDAIISQAAAGFPSADVSEDARTILAIDSGKTGFYVRLADIKAAAKRAISQTDTALLEKKRPQQNQALPNFVFRCSAIWRSLTNREPSAEKVHRRDSENPDFVIFVQDLAAVGDAARPTRDEIEVSLRVSLRKSPRRSRQKKL